MWSNEPPSGAKLTSSSSSPTGPVRSLSLALQEVASAGKETNYYSRCLSLSFSIWNSLKNIKLVCQSSMSNHWQHFMNRRNAGEPRMSILIFFVQANFVVPSKIELNFIASPIEIAYNISSLFGWSVGESIKRYSTVEFALNGIVWKQKNENKRARDVLGSPWQQQGVGAKKPETDPESYPNALTFKNKLGVHEKQIRQLAELFWLVTHCCQYWSVRWIDRECSNVSFFSFQKKGK